MQVTVVDSGGLPGNTFLSLHTGCIRRHVPLETGIAVHIPYTPSVSSSLSPLDAGTTQDPLDKKPGAYHSPVRVDLMSQVGARSIVLSPDTEEYEITLPPNPGQEPSTDASEAVKLKLRIRQAPMQSVEDATKKAQQADDEAECARQPDCHAKQKLQTAMMMRDYLDRHDVLRMMQDLLQDMAMRRPEDSLDYMIRRLEEVANEHEAAGGQPPLELNPADAMSGTLVR
eukprot:TRINITY_DN35019_c0_g1_i1.p1 TRINITY_DN35019_c0_g1~~TRINITY_DN35019_c0_g1_i1.p1  ORF type:complete len:228 (-),score=61.26 TRINITY_DN35019_c0_g1_i1:131-814(-)